MEPAQVTDHVSQAIGENSEATEQKLRDLFQAYLEQRPGDWGDVEQVLSAQSIVEYDKIPHMLGALKHVAGEEGDPEDPRTVFEHYELQGYFAPAGQDPGTGQAAGAAAGFLNPNFDGTPGTQFYKLDEATQQYLFADSSDSADWTTYERRRYSDPVWDESWRMFYRLDNTSNAYEYADAVTPGDKSSGVGETWLSQEEAQAHAAGQQATPASSEPGGADHTHLLLRVHREVMEPALAQFMAAHPELAEELGEPLLRELVAEVTAEHLADRIGSTTA